jgi:hypothetical protein
MGHEALLAFGFIVAALGLYYLISVERKLREIADLLRSRLPPEKGP